MIYVILSAAFKKDDDTEFEKLLKIGYCRDNPNNSIFNRKPNY